MNLPLRQRCFYPRPPLASARLTVRGLGIGDRLPPCTIDRPRGTGDHLLLCAHDEAEIDPAGTRLAAGQVMVWPPEARQFYRNQAGLRHSWLHADGTLLTGLLERCGIPLGRPFASGAGACCDRALAAIHRELAEDQPDEAIVAALLEAWLRALARNDSGGRRPLPGPYDAIRREIEASLDRRLRLDGLAARAGVSVQHLGRRFRALVGESPIAYHARLRMERAAWLLRDAGSRVAAVAEAVGCGDVYQFSKAFRRHHGCGPREWRRRLFAGDQAVAPATTAPATR